MEVLYPRCCGVDVHKKFLVACLLTIDENGQPHKELRRFSTMTADLLACVDWLEQAQCRAITRLDQNIAQRLETVKEQIERLDAIPELNRRSIEVLFAEVGWDRSPFPDAAHLASLVGICPGNYETGGKRLKGRTRKGNRYVKAILVPAAHGVATTQTYLGAQYRRLSARRGRKRAAVAVGHSILVI
jgi:transposase